MTLSDFIDQIGATNLAKTLDVSSTAVSSWKSGENCPRPQAAFLLTKLSHGQLTWASIYEPFVLKTLKGKTIRLPNGGDVILELKF